MSPAPVPSGTKITAEPITRPVGVGADGRTLTVTTTVAGCQQGRLLTRESASGVTLTLQLETRRPNGMACPDYIRLAPVQTVLTAPLGNRTLTDGTTGKQLAVVRTAS